MFELKRLSRDGIESAMEVAVRHRLLNQPRLAEGICRDVLAVEPDHGEALITLILALSDQLAEGRARAVMEAMGFVDRLESDYEREYYAGIVCERRAIGQLKVTSPGSGYIAYDWFRQAMAHYERAEEVKPNGNDNAVLRWNACARLINARADLRPAPDDRAQPMLE